MKIDYARETMLNRW